LDAAGARYYETGVSKGIFFPIRGGIGVPWNGLVSVSVDVSGGALESSYFDGVKYKDKILAEDFQATVTAVSTPREFDACEGVREYAPGVNTAFNKRDRFHMAWRTEIGNDEGTAVAYKIHIAYNCLVQPTARTYQTLADSVTMDSRAFVITSTPACGRHSYFWFDSRDYDLSALEAELYVGNLPLCSDLTALLSISEDFCLTMDEDLEEFVHGEAVAATDTDGTTQTNIYGLINNGLDVTTLPAEGTFAANDSAASVVGTSGVLADDDDATYITSADGDLGYTIGLPPLVGYVEGVAFQLNIRMSISGDVNPDDPDNLDADAQVFITTDSGGDLPVGGFSDGADEGMGFLLSAVDGSIVDYTVPLNLDAWNDVEISDVVAALETGAYLNIVGASNNNPATTPVVNVYEASIDMLNDTEPNKTLRARPGESEAWIKQKDLSSGSPISGANTTYIDFKIIRVPMDTLGVDNASQPVVAWGDIPDAPGWLNLEMDGDVPILKWYTDDGVTYSGISAHPDLDTWYTARVYWTWGSIRVTVWERDGLEVDAIMDHTDTAESVDPVVYVAHFAGLFNSTTVTYEVMIGNSILEENCHDAAPSAGTAFLHPGAITWDTPTSIFDTGVVNGSLPLQDNDDTTYIGIETDSDGSAVTYINRAIAPVYETYTDTPTSMTVHLRADIVSNDPAGGARISIELTDATDDTPHVVLTPGTFDWILADTGGLIQDFTLVMTDAYFTHWGTTLAAMAAVINAGHGRFVIQCNVSTTGAAVHTFVHMYKLELELS
jgi:hypothetical protein